MSEIIAMSICRLLIKSRLLIYLIYYWYSDLDLIQYGFGAPSADVLGIDSCAVEVACLLA